MSTDFFLKWHNHKMDIVSVFDELLSKEALVDVTLACEDFSLKAHKMVLSACSPFFQKLFLENPCKHPIIFLKDVSYSDLKAIVEFMYKGETMVPQKQMSTFLRTARSLKVIGLTTVVDQQRNGNNEQQSVKQMHLHTEATDVNLSNNKRNSLHKHKSESVIHQAPSKGFSSSAAVNEYSQDHDEPVCKRRLLNMNSTLGLQQLLLSQAPSSISVNRNMVKLAVDNKEVSEVTSNVPQVPTPENSMSDCSQQSLKTETTSVVRISSDDTGHKKSEDNPLMSPDVQFSASCSSVLEKNVTFSTQKEMKEPVSEISHTDGRMAKVLKKLPKSQILELHDTNPSDNEPAVIYEKIHTERNTFICDVCGKTFPHSGFLRLHKRIHSGERPWACELCNESFTQFTYLLQHQKNSCSSVNKGQINNEAQQLSDSSPDVT